MQLACSECSAPITKKARTGKCIRCANRHINKSPEHRAKIGASLRRHLSDPEVRARHCGANNARMEVWRKTPEGRAQILRNLDAGRHKGGETKRSWCPQEWRELDDIMRRRKYTLPERKAVIAEEIKRAERKRREAMTALDRQLEQLRNGARLIERPVMRVAEHAYSLTGGSMQGL